jgi:hypothetical protein
MTAAKRNENLAVISLGLCVIYFIFPTTYLLLVAAVIAFTSLIPPVGALVVKGWLALGQGLGWINSRIILTVIWYLFLTPIAFLYKLRGKDPLQLKKGESGSHFVTRKHQYGPKDLENPW